MSGYDANFRNTATSDLSTFDGAADHYGDANVLNLTPVLEPFMTLSCGTSTDWELKPQVGFSFFRSSSLSQNRRYNARQGNFVIDDIGPVDITVTATGFTPFVSLVRNNSVSEQATDGSGVLTHTVTEDELGPWTVEVTSIEPYAKGEFTIQISCSGNPTLLVPNPGDAIRFVAYSNQLGVFGLSNVGTTWTIISGALPSPLSMSSSGLITGTPTEAFDPSFYAATSFSKPYEFRVHVVNVGQGVDMTRLLTLDYQSAIEVAGSLAYPGVHDAANPAWIGLGYTLTTPIDKKVTHDSDGGGFIAPVPPQPVFYLQAVNGLGFHDAFIAYSTGPGVWVFKAFVYLDIGIVANTPGTKVPPDIANCYLGAGGLFGSQTLTLSDIPNSLSAVGTFLVS